MRARLESVAMLLLVIAALGVAAASIHREFIRPQPLAIDGNTYGPPTYVAGWERSLGTARRIGPASAPIKVVEFADFECPACRRAHITFAALRRHYADSLAVYYLYYPLSYHRFARIAARAAECSAEHGEFAAMHDLLFAKQDSLGLKSWASFADEAGMTDTLSFVRCVSDTTRVARVEDGLELGSKFGVRATPTILISGWRLATPPADSLAFTTLIEDILEKPGSVTPVPERVLDPALRSP